MEMRFVGRRRPRRLEVAGIVIFVYVFVGLVVVGGISILPSLVENLVQP